VAIWAGNGLGVLLNYVLDASYTVVRLLHRYQIPLILLIIYAP
jgi:hypothetical protein